MIRNRTASGYANGVGNTGKMRSVPCSDGSMSSPFYSHLGATLEQIKQDGFYKHERVIAAPQNAAIRLQSGLQSGEVLNFCANNYLGLADDARLIAAAKQGMDDFGEHVRPGPCG